MKTLRHTALFIAVFLSQFLNAQVTEKWTLEKCIDYALKHNVAIKQAAVNMQSAKIDHLQSKLNFLPTLDVNGSYSDNFGSGISTQTFSYAQGNSQTIQLQGTATVPLFTGLQQIYGVVKAKYDLLASKYDLDNASNNVALNVASAYLQVLLNKEILKVAEKEQDLTERQRDIVLLRIKSGALPETAIYDVDATMGRDKVTIVNSKNAIELSLLTLTQLLQLTDETAFVIDEPEVKADNPGDIASLTSQGIYKVAMDNQPVIKSAEARVMSAEITRKVAFGGYSPTLAAFASMSTGYFSQDKNYIYTSDTILGHALTFPSASSNTTLSQDFKNNFRQSVGIQLDIPLFNKGQHILNVQKSKLQIELRNTQLESSKNQLRQDIETAYANAKAASETYLANKTSLEASQQAYQSTETRYKAGIASNFDIEQAKQNVVNAESEMIKAKYTYVFRVKILDFYQGKALTLN